MGDNWFYEKDASGIAWLTFDLADSQTNTLSEKVLDEFDEKLKQISQDNVIALVIRSAKSSGFIAGADISGFRGITDNHEAQNYIEKVHGILFRLERMNVVTIALMHGFCLGGGLELALCCNYRVVVENVDHKAEFKTGFPEVKLGLFPGFGGSVRSVFLIGHLAALDLMLSGRIINARRAKHLGLVDYVIPERQIDATIEALVNSPVRRHKLNLWKQLPGLAIVRPLVSHFLAKQVRKRVSQEHYPAPFELIRHWEQFAGNKNLMFENEAIQVSRLLVSSTAQNLIRVFELQSRMKRIARSSTAEFQHVHVVGGGIMGGDIAAWCALNGLTVTLQDQQPQQLTRAMGRAFKLFAKKLRTPLAIRTASDRLIPDCDGLGVARADIVIEAIFEDIEAKQALFEQLEPRLKKEAVLASNTSSIPLEKLAEKLENPQRLVGLHFFNPVAKMQLVEVIKAADTDEDMLQRALSFTLKIRKLPLTVKSSPGFLVNRVLMPYLIKAVELYESGVAANVIDASAVDFGMPMGPVELADTVGLDICLSVAEKLASTLNIEVPEVLRQKVAEGKLGKKTGSGFFSYENGRKHQSKQQINIDKGLAKQLIEKLLSESQKCLQEGIVEDADLIDAGIIFGTGFAPFRGGPLHYLKQEH